MDNNDFSNLGKQIQDTVQQAMDSMDFDKLNQTINQTVTQALDEAKMHKEKIQRQYEQSRANQQYQQPHRQANYAKPNYQANYAKPNYQANYVKPVSKKEQLRRVIAPRAKKGTWKIVFGVSTAWFAWFMLLGFFEAASVARDGFALTIIFFIVMALPAVVIVGISAKGIRQRLRYSRAKKYAEILNGRGFCEIKELAKQTGKTEVYVRNDVRKLIQKEYFREAYMDRQETCLMVNKESYDYYLQAEESLHEREAEEAKKKQAEEKLSPEVIEMIRVGDEYIRTIREANDDIPGEVISAKLDQLETIVKRIFDSVKKHPEQKKEMDKFMDYYMPTTLKLVNAYREFDVLEVKGTNVQSAMNEIENTLDTIIAAFEKLLDDLFQDAAFDVATDISVLQTMLAREGYKGNDFQ